MAAVVDLRAEADRLGLWIVVVGQHTLALDDLHIMDVVEVQHAGSHLATTHSGLEGHLAVGGKFALQATADQPADHAKENTDHN